MSGWGHLMCGGVHMLDGPVALELCARCTGIYLVFGIAMAVMGAGFRRSCGSEKRLKEGDHTGRPYGMVVAAVLILAAPLHAIFLPEASNLARFASGTMTGAGLAILIVGRVALPVGILAAAIALAAGRAEGAYRVLEVLLLPSVIVSFAAPLLVLSRRMFPPASILSAESG